MPEDYRVKTSWRTSRKRRMLEARLGPYAVIAVHDLWSYCASARPDGDLSGLSDEEIAAEADYRGPGDLVGAMEACGLVDGEPMSRRVHDWAQHNPWVSGHTDRSRNARMGGFAKNHSKHHIPVDGCPLCEQQCSNLLPAVLAAENSSAGSSKQQCSVSVSVSVPDSVPDPKPEETESPEVASDSGQPVQEEPHEKPIESPVVIMFSTVGGSSDYGITEAQVAIWSERYPAVDIMQNLRAMQGWLIANPTRRKTKRGVPKFIESWLAREQDKGGSARSSMKPSPSQVQVNEPKGLERVRRFVRKWHGTYGILNWNPQDGELSHEAWDELQAHQKQLRDLRDMERVEESELASRLAEMGVNP